jgi:hypothetical protein
MALPKPAVELMPPGQTVAPGQVIRARAVITADAPWEVEYAEVLLGWRTEGRGDMDAATAEKWEMIPRGQTAPLRLEHEFTFRLPPFPQGYQGKLFQLNWFVGVYAKPRGEVEFFAEKRLETVPLADDEPAGTASPDLIPDAPPPE